MVFRGKKFVGKTVAEALEKATQEFGKDIVFTIVEQKKGGFLKLFGRQRSEILAGPTPASKPAVAECREEKPATFLRKELLRQKYGGNIARIQPKHVAHPPQSARETGDGKLAEAIGDMRQLLSSISSRVNELSGFRPPEELAEIYLKLLDSHVSTFLAQRIIAGIQTKLPGESLNNSRVIGEAVRNIIQDMISVSGPIALSPNGHKRIAFVGPTGVGKTSTIAKLAGNFVRMKKRVGTITVDTYKLGATEQLAQFANIMRIPIAVVRDPGSSHEINKALAAMKDRDIVLIDTFGESPRNSHKLLELKKALDLLKPHETHLVMSCTTHPDNLTDTLQKFSIIRIDKLILTKTDEAAKFGLLLTVLEKVSTGLSYITNGQAVPEDIQEADAGRLADMVLGGDNE
ncbi:MAG: flagellar biosynthesis protein FlhF [Planctomycetota bacterium]|nr:flagellar biosynthesis protein FlhF [Planctomycetota bacterium]